MYSFLPLKKKCFHRSRTEWPFWSGVCPKLYILQCKTTFAFTTLVRNGHLRVSGSKNRTKVFSFIVQKNALSPLSYGMPILGRECVQRYVFCDAKRASPSPLSYEMAILGHPFDKMVIPCERGEGEARFDRQIQCYLLLRRTFWSSGAFLVLRGCSKMGELELFRAIYFHVKMHTFRQRAL